MVGKVGKYFSDRKELQMALKAIIQWAIDRKDRRDSEKSAAMQIRGNQPEFIVVDDGEIEDSSVGEEAEREGKRIRGLCVIAGLRVSDLALRTRLAEDLVRSYGAGKVKIPEEHLAAICGVLGVGRSVIRRDGAVFGPEAQRIHADFKRSARREGR